MLIFIHSLHIILCSKCLENIHIDDVLNNIIYMYIKKIRIFIIPIMGHWWATFIHRKQYTMIKKNHIKMKYELLQVHPKKI